MPVPQYFSMKEIQSLTRHCFQQSMPPQWTKPLHNSVCSQSLIMSSIWSVLKPSRRAPRLVHSEPAPVHCLHPWPNIQWIFVWVPALDAERTNGGCCLKLQGCHLICEIRPVCTWSQIKYCIQIRLSHANKIKSQSFIGKKKLETNGAQTTTV